MTPAAFLQTDRALDADVAARGDDNELHVVRNPRRVTPMFITSDAQAPLFHAWRP